MIGSVFAVTRFTHDPVFWVYGLAFGVVIGGVLQLVLQVPFLVQKGVTFWRSSQMVHPGLRKIAAMFLPATFGAAVLQINTLVGNLLASFQPEGSISYLYFAERLVQFPLGVIGISAATAALPAFSRLAAASDSSALKDTFAYAINMVLFLIVPAMVGLIVLRGPIVMLLFQRGAFSTMAARLTADALLYYAVGLWAFATLRIVAATFYAQQDVRTPVRCAVISIVANCFVWRRTRALDGIQRYSVGTVSFRYSESGAAPKGLEKSFGHSGRRENSRIAVENRFQFRPDGPCGVDGLQPPCTARVRRNGEVADRDQRQYCYRIDCIWWSVIFDENT